MKKSMADMIIVDPTMLDATIVTNLTHNNVVTANTIAPPPTATPISRNCVNINLFLFFMEINNKPKKHTSNKTQMNKQISCKLPNYDGIFFSFRFICLIHAIIKTLTPNTWFGSVAIQNVIIDPLVIAPANAHTSTDAIGWVEPKTAPKRPATIARAK